jgi:hypothetical protein
VVTAASARLAGVCAQASGRWQARYLGPDGITRNAPMTFETDRQANKWLTVVESEIIGGEWSAPEAGEVKLAAYGRSGGHPDRGIERAQTSFASHGAAFGDDDGHDGWVARTPSRIG